MTLYAVHHAWIDDHAVKVPVGIWGEGGASFYPAEPETYRKKESQAETEASQMLWRHWVEKRTEWGSTYGVSWSAVESDAPMDKVLTNLRAEFLLEPHQIKKIFRPMLKKILKPQKTALKRKKKILKIWGQANPHNGYFLRRVGGLRRRS